MSWHAIDSTSQFGFVYFPTPNTTTTTTTTTTTFYEVIFENLELSSFTAGRGVVWQGVYFSLVFAVKCSVMLEWDGKSWQSAFFLRFVVSMSSPCCNLFFFKVSTVLRPKHQNGLICKLLYVSIRVYVFLDDVDVSHSTPPLPSHERSITVRCTWRWYAPPLLPWT